MSTGESNVISGTPSSSSSPHQPLMRKSESSERFRGEVASLDAVSIESEVGELKKESAQSAFEITSVEPAPDDDLDTTGRVQPASMDDSTLKTKLESGDSEEEAVSLSEEQRQNALKSPSDGEPSPSSGLSSSSGVDLTRGQQGVSATGNGPSVQPGGGRFRKVNKYTRGRWTVRDMETTEERLGAEGTVRHPSQGAGSRLNLEPGSGSPSVSRKTEQQESLHSRSGSELGQASNVMVIPGGGAPSDNVSDKDSTSLHFDRSSTAADTLSRNTSLSSINAPDDRSTDVDIDSQALSNVGEGATSGDIAASSTGGSTGAPPPSSSSSSLPSHTPQHATISQTSSQEGADVTSTHLSREHPMSQLNGPLDAAANEIQPSESTIKEAMAHLQKQLEVLLTSKTGMQQMNTQLSEKIQGLNEKVKHLEDENSILKQLVGGSAPGVQQASQLHDRNRALEDENLRLKTELQHLKTSLSILVKGAPEDASGIDASSRSSVQHSSS